MPRKIVVNGIEYDSPDAMPPDVRRQYERALQTIQDLGEGTRPSGATEKTAEHGPDGVSITLRVNDVQYNVDGKTYSSPADLPPEVRRRVERALSEATHLEVRSESPREVQILHVDTGPPGARGRRIVWWLVLAAIVALVVGLLLPE